MKELNYTQMKKLLIVSGCSFTDGNYISNVHPEMDCSWPKWPELLAKKLDMDCINLGHSGAGNEYIYSSLLEEILKQKFKHKREIGLVIPAWSQCQRQDWQELKSFKWRESRYFEHGDIFGWLKKSLRHMISLQEVCNSFNIPIKQCQMINLFDGWINGLTKTDKEIWDNKDDINFIRRLHYPGFNPETDRNACLQIILDYEPFINVKNFIGWPISRSIGGYNIEEHTIRKNTFKDYDGAKDEENWEPLIYHTNYNEDMLISIYDVHPNAKGHKEISEFIYGQLG